MLLDSTNKDKVLKQFSKIATSKNVKIQVFLTLTKWITKMHIIDCSTKKPYEPTSSL